MNAWLANLLARFWAWYRPRPEEPDSAKLLRTMLADAQLVAVYIQRAGLQKGAALAMAIAKVEAIKDTATWASEEVVVLQTTLGDAMNAIAPTTIDSLRGPSPPFSHTPSQSIQTFSFMVLLAFLAITTAFFTIAFNEGNSVAAKIASIQERGTQQELATVVSRLAFAIKEGESDETDTNIATRIASYVGDMAKLRQLDDDFQFYNETVNTFFVGQADMLIWPLASNSQNAAVDQIDATMTGAIAKASLGSGQGMAEQTPIAPSAEQSQPVMSKQIPPPCSPEGYKGVEQRLASMKLENTTVGQVMTDNDIGSLRITCALGLTYHLNTLPPFPAYAIKIAKIVNLYGLWILPALYGALGGLTFYLRRMLNPALPNPHPMRIITRCLIASLAGILIASFWAPTIAKNEVFSNAGLNLFAIAFLAGYSIDVFFYLLDQFSQSARINIAKFTAENPNPPPGGNNTGTRT